MSDAPSSSRGSGSGSGKGERRERRRRKRRERKEPAFFERNGKLFTGLALFAGSVVAALATYLLVVFPASAGPGKGADVEVTFGPDDGPGIVADKLAAANLVASPRIFAIYLRLTRPRIAPGEHLLTDDASPQEIVRRIERLGTAAKAKVTIPEGWNRFDIAKRLHALHVTSAASFLAASSDAALLHELALEGESAEGFLFPATYDFAKDTDPRDIVRRLVSEFDKRFSQIEQNHRLGRAHLEGSLGWGRREIVTLASMVEREAAVDDERPVIASVFLNRLRDPSFKRKLLQCDPTSAYGCLVLRERVPACSGFTGKVTHAINADPMNTYSTYVREGLPPGPIANPGTKSIQAVLAPASTKYFYFVTRGEARRHAFSETLEEHAAAVKDWKDRTSHKNE